MVRLDFQMFVTVIVEGIVHERQPLAVFRCMYKDLSYNPSLANGIDLE